mmetsp:Transcript_63234/g.193436  ORF Transcript_63234/g.193436 Transcript_63234/m.193436 type:complete len:286 (-) Transcript_63234:671-1528(-)
MSWGSGAPSSATGAFTPVWTWEIQSNRIARILALTDVLPVTNRGREVRSSSRKTSHFADARTACFPASLIGLPHRSSSSNITLLVSAAANAKAPLSPMQLSRRDSLRKADPGELRTLATALAPASPMRFAPKHNSPRPPFCGDKKARATALAPMSPRPKALCSSSKRNGGAKRHSRHRARRQMAHRRARAPKAGSRSMMSCKISLGSSFSPMPLQIAEPWLALPGRRRAGVTWHPVPAAVPLKRPPAPGVDGSFAAAEHACGAAKGSAERKPIGAAVAPPLTQAA